MSDPSALLLKNNLKMLRLPTMLAEYAKLSREAADANEDYEQYLLPLSELEVATRSAIASLGGRVKLHFLLPYCPEGNLIERIWLDLHANVTRNHRCQTMSDLMSNVYHYLRNRNRRLRRHLKAAA